MNRYLEKARAGDRKAENQLFQILHARFLIIAKRRLREQEEAEDVVQQSCVTMLQKYKTEQFPGGFEAWAYTVLRMKIGNYLQFKRVRQEDHSRDSGGARRAGYTAREPDWGLESALIDCLKKIVRANPRYARVLNLSYQGYQVEEICNRLDVTRSNLYSMLSRSRSMLNLCLETGRV